MASFATLHASLIINAFLVLRGKRLSAILPKKCPVICSQMRAKDGM
jgi:hypothetical protein